MNIALFSDIHANLPALQAVLADIDRRKPDAIYCQGDLVGYAPYPNEVIRLIRERKIPTIAGNYDEGIGLASDNCGCAYKTDHDESNGAVSIDYTNQIIGTEERRFLKHLPRHFAVDFEFNREKFRCSYTAVREKSMNTCLKTATRKACCASWKTHTPTS